MLMFSLFLTNDSNHIIQTTNHVFGLFPNFALIRQIYSLWIYIYCLDCPGECGRCTVIDWMPTFADLTWSQPFTDGGAPITSYIIQLKG